MFYDLNKNFGKMFDDLKFCVTALDTDKDEMRMHKKYMYVVDKVCCSTDGTRLHTIQCDIENGWYQVVKNTKTILQIVKIDSDNWDYPDFKEFINIDLGEHICIGTGDLEMFETLFARTVRRMDDTQSINHEYLKDILKLGDFTVYVSVEKNEPVIVTGQDINTKAIIMPIKLK